MERNIGVAMSESAGHEEQTGTNLVASGRRCEFRSTTSWLGSLSAAPRTASNPSIRTGLAGNLLARRCS